MNRTRIEALQAMLREEWSRTAISALEDMIQDIRAGAAEGDVDFGIPEKDTLEKHFNHLRHLMSRRRQLATEIRMYRGGHRKGRSIT